MMVGVCEKGEVEYNRGNESKGICQLWLGIWMARGVAKRKSNRRCKSCTEERWGVSSCQ